MITETTTHPRPPSGRAVVHRKRRVDECRFRLDLATLRRNGLFAHPSGSGWPIRLGSPFPAELVYARYEDPCLGRCFAIAELGPNRAGPVRALILAARLEWMPCHFGGGRFWFNCPRLVNGRECGRRVRVLYLPPGADEFGCRVCHGLSYESRQLHRNRVYGWWHTIDTVPRLLADLHSTRGWRRRFRALCRIDPELAKFRRELNRLQRARSDERDQVDG